MKLKIVKKIAKEHPFNSRNWNYQKIIRPDFMKITKEYIFIK